MTLTERIASALKEPIDKEIRKEVRAIIGMQNPIHTKQALYTLLRERNALLAQVEAERWRSNTIEKPEHRQQVLIRMFDGSILVATWWSNYERFRVEQGGLILHEVTHWKPINLPTV